MSDINREYLIGAACVDDLAFLISCRVFCSRRCGRFVKKVRLVVLKYLKATLMHKVNRGILLGE